MILTKTVKMRWSGNNRNWYEVRGYVFTKYKDEFEVKVEDLSDGSKVKVDIKCDGCGEILTGITWSACKRGVYANDDKHYCHTCIVNVFSAEKSKQTKLKNGKSFYQWCYDNLSKEDAEEILLRWDYALNKISPNEVNFGSKGFNNKGYWFKCFKHPEHKSEQKNINSFTSGQKGSITCKQCDMIAYTHPELIKLLVNKEDAFKYSYGSHETIPMRCPDCGYEKEIILNSLTNGVFNCPKCKSGSYPEKFLFNVFEQLLDKNFKTQLSKTTFKWCNKYRYDLYINEINTICEVNGEQHYEVSKGKWGSLEEIQENDKNKKDLAKANNIDHYVVLDCRKSDMDWIKNSIMESDLPNLLNFKEDDIDWLKCHKWACSSLVKVVCDMWNKDRNKILIEKELKISASTVGRYLKKGAILGLCEYDPKTKQITYRVTRKIICITTNFVFNSIAEASNKYSVDGSSISKCCKGKYKGAGKLPDGTILTWMYYDEYLNNVGGEI